MADHPTPLMLRACERRLHNLLSRADAMCNRWYGWRFNPLYQSGTIVVGLYLTLLVSGLWLLFFYRIGSPWESVDAMTSSRWLGSWARGLHRYATDAAVVFTVAHALRMFAQARSWGARSLAWISGGLLVALMLLCAWTGYVMVWDTFAERLARDAARVADALPILSEPVSRALTGERPVPGVFFFITLFAHVGVPLAMGVVFWLHVKRLQRPVLLPPRPLMWAVVGLLTAAAVVRPVVMAPKANPFVVPATIPVDPFVAFWVPLAEVFGGGPVLAGLLLMGVGLLVAPFFTARRGASAPPPSLVDEDVCTGCTQCSIDCPYGAIEMTTRRDERPTLVARVDASLCVSCGICAGSCAPMGIGPPGRTGRDQLAGVQSSLRSGAVPAGTIVVVGCERGAAAFAPAIGAEAATFHGVTCAGNLHSSVIEAFIRGGAGGVLILTCPPRDCWTREGPRWLHERLYHDREAELQARVPRSRVRVVAVTNREQREAIAALRTFAADIAALGTAQGPDNGSAVSASACDPLAESVGAQP